MRTIIVETSHSLSIILVLCEELETLQREIPIDKPKINSGNKHIIIIIKIMNQ